MTNAIIHEQPPDIDDADDKERRWLRLLTTQLSGGGIDTPPRQVDFGPIAGQPTVGLGNIFPYTTTKGN